MHGLPIGRRVVQTPSDPGMLHAAFTAHCGSAQQTPSVQLPDAHCSPALHGTPFDAGGPQVPVLQNWPCGHAADAQQKPSTHRRDWHCSPEVQRLPFGAGGRQTPSRIEEFGGKTSQRCPSGQDGVAQQTLSTHAFDSHWRPTTHDAPFGLLGGSLPRRIRTELLENSATAMSGTASPVKSMAAMRRGPKPTMT